MQIKNVWKLVKKESKDLSDGIKSLSDIKWLLSWWLELVSWIIEL